MIIDMKFQCLDLDLLIFYDIKSFHIIFVLSILTSFLIYDLLFVCLFHLHNRFCLPQHQCFACASANINNLGLFHTKGRKKCKRRLASIHEKFGSVYGLSIYALCQWLKVIFLVENDSIFLSDFSDL